MEEKIIEVVCLCGVGIIGYFLRSLHQDFKCQVKESNILRDLVHDTRLKYVQTTELTRIHDVMRQDLLAMESRIMEQLGGIRESVDRRKGQ